MISESTSHSCAYLDGEFGVIGMPRNSFMEKTDYRAQAELLMDRHFPEGHEIVRADEVSEGQRTLDLGKKTEVGAEPNLTGVTQRLNFVKLDRSTSFEEKDQLQLRECRIIYRRKAAGTSGRPSQFAADASLTPPLYVNPSDALRHQAGKQMLAKADSVPKRKVDADAVKVSGTSTD